MNIPKEIIEAAARLKEVMDNPKTQTAYPEYSNLKWCPEYHNDKSCVLTWAIKEVLAWENQIQGGP